MCFAPQRRALFRHLSFQKWSGPGVFCTGWHRNVRHATTACTFSTSQLPKVVRTRCVWYMLASKCASRHNRVHFFDISTSKNGPNVACFVHVGFEMCFVPQPRALFRHLNFQKWSKRGVFCTCWLRDVLRASPFELGGWGWGHPKCSGPGNFLYNVSQLNLQNGLPGNFSSERPWIGIFTTK